MIGGGTPQGAFVHPFFTVEKIQPPQKISGNKIKSTKALYRFRIFRFGVNMKAVSSDLKSLLHFFFHTNGVSVSFYILWGGLVVDKNWLMNLWLKFENQMKHWSFSKSFGTCHSATALNLVGSIWIKLWEKIRPWYLTLWTLKIHTYFVSEINYHQDFENTGYIFIVPVVNTTICVSHIFCQVCRLFFLYPDDKDFMDGVVEVSGCSCWSQWHCQWGKRSCSAYKQYFLIVTLNGTSVVSLYVVDV